MVWVIAEQAGEHVDLDEQTGFEHPAPEHVDLEQESERQDSERQESEPDEPKRVSDDGPHIELDGSEHCSAPPHLSGSFQ